MAILNIEFKARSGENEKLEKLLGPYNPEYIGEDFQTDTYFNVPNGRLKLREGNIENALIHYERNNIAAARQSSILLYRHHPDKDLKELLTKSLGIRVIVSKRRKIYYIDNIKFHFDYVDQLGSFVEVEAIDVSGNIGLSKLREQCDFYKSVFSIQDHNLVNCSYSDLILQQQLLTNNNSS